MEKIREKEEVLNFLRVDEYPSGYGSGSGDGSLIKYDGNDVHYIDGLPTIITSVHGTFAKGAIVNLDFTLDPCFIARVGDSFAHGQTLAEAHRDATSKHTKNMPIEDRIVLFNSTYPDRSKPIPAKELFDWHNILTGSCLMGRKEWCRSHGINIERDSFTVNEFIKLTKNSYGGEIIIKL